MGDGLMFAGGMFPTALGLRIRESEAATALPSGKPRTDDMRAMVEHFERLGLIQRRPAIFQVNNEFIVHPDLMERLRVRLAQDAVRRTKSLLFGGSHV